jgi:hypothetical protein
MNFFAVLSLPEASFAFMGLAIQSIIRASGLRHWVAAVIGVWTVLLLYRGLASGNGVAAVWRPLGYLATCLIFCVLFWPEILVFRAASQTVAPADVLSYAASEDPNATIVSAADTDMVPESLQAPALISPGFRLLLPVVTGYPLAIARAINSKTHRTFDTLLPLQWLTGMSLTAGATTAIQDWTHNCYLPTLTQLHTGGGILTNEDTQPWGGTALRRALAERSVSPGSQTGITTTITPGRTELPCDTYLDAVLADTIAWLRQVKSPAGTSLLQVFQEDLGMEPLAQAQTIVRREMDRAAGPEVPAPSLAAAYAGLRGAGLIGQTGGGLLNVLQGMKALAGAALGGGKALVNEWQHLIDGLSWIVGAAVFLTWWAPYILGIANLVLLGLFSVYFLFWCLIPGHQFAPLLSYFIALWFTCSAPLWWALVDLAARLATSLAPQADDAILGVGNGVMGFIWSSAITVLGLLVIMSVMAWLLFGTLRSIGGALRAV